MQKYISTAVFSFLLLGVIILTALNYHNNDVLESRINTVTKYSKELKSEKSFKEDYYIQQQSRDTTLLLLVFGVVVTVIGFFTYQNLAAKFDLKTSELKTVINKYREEWTDLNDELGLLKVSYFYESATLSIEHANLHIPPSQVDKFSVYNLRASSKYADIILWIRKRDEMDKENNIKDNVDPGPTILTKITEIKTLLSRVNNRLDDTHKVRPSSIFEIEKNINNIRELKNDEINRLLSDIQSKINKK